MTDAAHILVIDDDPAICEELTEYLSGQGYKASAAGDGEAMYRVLDAEPVDLIVLDLKLPREHGLDLTRSLRQRGNLGIIILTGTGEPIDKIVGLELGADDYLAKPCDLRELLARIRSVLRRVQHKEAVAADSDEPVLAFSGCTLDVSGRRLISSQSDDIPLTTAEFNLLLALVCSPKRVLNRDHLMDVTHGRDWSPFDRSIDNLVSRLRQKIEPDPENPTYIKTVRGVGYVFTQTVTKKS